MADDPKIVQGHVGYAPGYKGGPEPKSVAETFKNPPLVAANVKENERKTIAAWVSRQGHRLWLSPRPSSAATTRGANEARGRLRQRHHRALLAAVLDADELRVQRTPRHGAHFGCTCVCDRCNGRKWVIPDKCPTCSKSFADHAVPGACPICGRPIGDHPRTACPNGDGWYNAAEWYEAKRKEQKGAPP